PTVIFFLSCWDSPFWRFRWWFSGGANRGRSARINPQETNMIPLGLLVTLLGFIISFLSLGMTSSVSGRLVMVLIALAVSLTGILGILNRAFLKNAIWRK